MPISAGVCMFQPGSVYSGGTWHAAQRAFPLKSSSPGFVERANGLRSSTGAGIASW